MCDSLTSKPTMRTPVLLSVSLLVGLSNALQLPGIPVKITVPVTVPTVLRTIVNESVQVVTSPKDVCFGYLGCFSMSAPWHSLLRPLPTPHEPEKIETRFYMYNRATPQRWNVTTLPQINLQASGYDGKKTTFFITHGFSSNGNSSWLSEMKDALLKRFDANVFLVDWGKGASLFNYFQVAANTRVVGAEAARLVNHLIKREGSDPSRIHLIGHSLGAQISSYIAKRVPNVAKLTALDPAQPAFEGFDKEVRLDKTDANFIQVIHTTAKPFIPFIGLGMIDSYGDVDYYLNGGWKQPGCIIPPKPNITSFLDLATVPVEVIGNFISCPHGRSYEFLTASLNSDNCTFWGHARDTLKNIVSTLSAGHAARALTPRECNVTTCSPLGFEAINYPARGSFDVATTSDRPYCVSEPEVDAQMKPHRLNKSQYS